VITTLVYAIMSLDAFPSDYSPSSAFLVGWRVASALARRLWEAYVDCLWHFQPNSWVGRLASTFRILAVVLVFPVVLLTLLDVSSYVIARTLGIVDDIKASTVDADADVPSAGSVTSPPDDAQTQISVADAVQVSMSASARAQKKTKTASSTNTGTDMNTNTNTSKHGVGASVPASEGYVLLGSEELNERLAEQGCASERAVGTSSSSVNVSLSAVRGHDHAQTAPAMAIKRRTQQDQVQMKERQQHQEEETIRLRSVDDDDDCSDREATRSDAVPSSHHHAYHFAGEDHLRLAGEGVFSPAVSMPPSPLTPRMRLHALTAGAEGGDDGGREVFGQVGEGGVTIIRRRAQGVREDEPGHHA